MKVRLAFFIKVTGIIKGLYTVDAIFIAAFNSWIFKALFITPASIYLFKINRGNAPEQCVKTCKS